MCKPEILETVFVAGSVLAGMTGHVGTKAPQLLGPEKLVRVALVSFTGSRAWQPVVPNATLFMQKTGGPRSGESGKQRRPGVRALGGGDEAGRCTR